jgi:hypothetical protein
MKRVILGIVVIILIAVCALSLEKRHLVKRSLPNQVATTSHERHLSKPAVKSPPLLSVGEWQKYHAARQGALTANPGLRDEYQGLLSRWMRYKSNRMMQ